MFFFIFIIYISAIKVTSAQCLSEVQISQLHPQSWVRDTRCESCDIYLHQCTKDSQQSLSVIVCTSPDHNNADNEQGMGSILEKNSWRRVLFDSNAIIGFLMVGLEKLMEMDFACPCNPKMNLLFSAAYFVIPALFSGALMFYIQSPIHFYLMWMKMKFIK